MKKNKLVGSSAARTGLAVSAGLSFYVLCMMLSLVGPAGSKVEHADKNQALFLSVLLLTLVLAGLSTWLGLRHRRAEEGPLPRFSIGLGLVCVLMLIVLFLGGFSI